MENRQNQFGNDTAETQTTTIDDEIWDQAYDAIPPCDSTPEVDRFAVLPVANRKGDILKWWITRQTDFPKLSRLAMDYLAFPASSVPAERANSAGGVVDEPLTGEPVYTVQLSKWKYAVVRG